MERVVVPAVIKAAKNKPAFDFDCITQIEGVDPLAPRFTEFDWTELGRALGEPEDEDDPGRDMRQVASTLCEILRWIVKGNNLEIMGRRAVALASTLDIASRRFPSGRTCRHGGTRK